MSEAQDKGAVGSKSKNTSPVKKSRHDFVEGDRYAPAPESSEHVTLKDSYDLFIGGEWVRAPKRTETRNPATGESLSEVGEAGPRMVERAVSAARHAYEQTLSLIHI